MKNLKLSATMKARLVRLHKAIVDKGLDMNALRTDGTYAALARRELIEYGEHVHASDFAIRFTEQGLKVAEELRAAEAAQDAPEALEDDQDDAQPPYSDYAFPADVERVAQAHPIGTRVTGTNLRGVRVAGVVTGYAQYGSPREGYTTAIEIDREETTGEYTLIPEGNTETETTETEADVPSVVSFSGGKVHKGTPGAPAPFPGCRTGGQDSGGTAYQNTGQAVNCRSCIRLYGLAAHGVAD